MSCDWDIRCLDCNETLGLPDANHRIKLMRCLIQHREAIEALNELTNEGDVEIRTSYGSIDTAWFMAHKGHKLAPVNEYGDLEE